MAKLESLSLNEPCIVSARATVPNAEAAQIEFGIAFSRLSDAEVRLSMEECSLGAEGPDFSFTGWRRVSFDQPMLISQTLIGNEGHLFFATRMADRAPEWYAWATFGDLRQTLLGRKDWKSPIAPVEQPLKSVRTPQTRSDPVIDWLGSERGLGFNVATRGVDCTPPKSGVALKRLPTIAIDAGFQFTANLCSSDDGVGIVEFGVVVTDLPPGNILTAVNARGAMWDETRLVFSGWRKASAGTTPRIVVEPSTLQVSSAHIFLMTRLAGKTARNTRVIASFEQMTVGVPERELEVP
jgi:hypothetical protein